jgi:hypothetical protein
MHLNRYCLRNFRHHEKVLMSVKTRRNMTKKYAGEYPYILLNKKGADLSPLCFATISLYQNGISSLIQ